MIINIPLERKATEIDYERCQVDVVVKLTHGNFEYLKNCTLDDYDFVKESLDKLHFTHDNIRHCIMVLDEAGNDGILIDPQGHNYPRYTAYVPNAKQLLMLDQYPSLQVFHQNMIDTVEEVTQLALNSHHNGTFTSDLEEIEADFQPYVLDKYLLADMLGQRPEIKSVELDNGAIVMRLNEGCIENRNTLTPNEVREMLARHTLWGLGLSGGEKADFSNEIIQDFNFQGADLSQAVMDNTSFICCDFSGVNLDNASAENAEFNCCRFVETGVNSVNLKGSYITVSNCYDSTFWNCDCTDVLFQNCDLTKAEFINCCLANAGFDGGEIDSINIRDCTEEPERLTQESSGDAGISM